MYFILVSEAFCHIVMFAIVEQLCKYTERGGVGERGGGLDKRGGKKKKRKKKGKKKRYKKKKEKRVDLGMEMDFVSVGRTREGGGGEVGFGASFPPAPPCFTAP